MKDGSAVSRQDGAKRLLVDHFRCPDELVDLSVAGDLSAESGYFRFGSGAICYGQCSSGTPAPNVSDTLHDAHPFVSTNGTSAQLPFDPVQVVDNLRHEHYRENQAQSRKGVDANSFIRSLYYLIRPLMPIVARKHLQRRYFREWDKIPFPNWPVDFTVESILEQILILSMKFQGVSKLPFIWFWPDEAPSCTIVTHDVETAAGRDFCIQLMDLNDTFGIKSAFQIVPEKRYPVPPSLLDCMRERGFEVNVHDLNHDGHLMENHEEFLRRAKKINRYAMSYGAQGFRAAMLYRNIDWYDALDVLYDMSIPNVAHLDPQRGGCCTAFPFFNGRIVELPVTIAQDYSLFHILNDYSTELWKHQISLIRERYALIQVIVHPDYILGEAERRVYAELLGYLAELRSLKETWIALPGEVAAWWRIRNDLKLVSNQGSWKIEGDGKERARIAYATVTGKGLAYSFDPVT
jgi:hypothetical protein